MWFIHLTDLHMSPPGHLAYGCIDTNARAASAVNTIRSLPNPPDLVVVSGDISDRAEPEAYGAAQELLATLGLPVLLVPGNHDNAGAMEQVFGKSLAIGPASTHAHRFIRIDSAVPGQGEGRITQEDLERLHATVTSAATHLVLVLHHPPGVTGGGIDIPGALGGEAELAHLLKNSDTVAAILAGHVHRPRISRFAGVPLVIGPSTAYGKLAPPAWPAEGLCREEPPAFLAHQVDPNGVLSTQFFQAQHIGPALALRNGKVLARLG